MNSTIQPPQNGAVSIETFRDRATGKFFLAVVHVDRDGKAEIVGQDYANMDEAKSAAWQLAQRLDASPVPTRRVRT